MIYKNWRDSGLNVIKPTELVWANINDKWTGDLWEAVSSGLRRYKFYSFPVSNNAKTRGLMVGHLISKKG